MVRKIVDSVVSVNEASLGRLVQHIGKDCILFMSASRSEYTKEENKKRYEDLKQIVKTANFGFNRILCRGS